MATVIELEPDVEALVASLVEQGGFASASEAVNASLRQMQPADGEEWLAEVERSVAVARGQIARGEGLSGDRVFDELRHRYRNWPR